MTGTRNLFFLPLSLWERGPGREVWAVVSGGFWFCLSLYPDSCFYCICTNTSTATNTTICIAMAVI